MIDQQNPILSSTLNKYLDLYKMAKHNYLQIYMHSSIRRYDGCGEDYFPYHLRDLSDLATKVSVFKSRVYDDIVEGLLGDLSEQDKVESKIAYINLKTSQIFWVRLCEDYCNTYKEIFSKLYDEKWGGWERYINIENFRNIFSPEQAQQLEDKMNEIDYDLYKIASIITNTIQQIRKHYLQIPDKDEPCDLSTDLPSLSPELDKPEVKAVFQKAIEKGLMNDKMDWFENKDLLSIFCARIFAIHLIKPNPDLNPDGSIMIHWKDFEETFTIKGKPIKRDSLKTSYNKAKTYNPKKLFLIDEIIPNPSNLE